MNRCLYVMCLTLALLMGEHMVAASCLQMGGKDIRADFTQLDWNELRIDSTLPYYTEVIPLESDYRNYDYKVSLDYPEYTVLTPAEREVALQFDSLIRDSIQIASSIGVQRKAGFLDISFIPVIRKDGRYLKLLSARVTISPLPKAAHARKVLSQSTTRYADHSVLREGKWVKIYVTQDGIYSLTRSRLRRMGFSNPDKVRLYGYGGHRQKELIQADSDYDDLQEIPLLKQDDNTWLFWANGLVYWNGDSRVFNPYSTKAYYFLTEGDSPLTMGTLSDIPSSASANEISSFRDHVLYEKDEYAWFWGGCNLYDGVNYASSNSHTYSLRTQDSQGGEKLTVSFTASSDAKTQLLPNVNGQDLSVMTMSPISKYIYATSATSTYDVSEHSTGNLWTVKLTSTAGHDARLDYLAVHYQRRIVVPSNDGYIAFSSSETRPSTFAISCNPSDTRLVRIDYARHAAELVNLEVKDDKTAMAAVADPSLRYVALDITHSFPEPNYVGEVENQDLHAVDSLDMVIIIPANAKLQSEAQRLADAHAEYDGLRVGVFRADHIYNEFSSGTPDATAYRRFMKMLYDRAQSDKDAPRYLLLMGDCAWDNRMVSTAWKKYSPDDYLLCYESENSFSDTRCYVMEDYFGLLDDGEGANLLSEKSDLGIGRFPVTTVAEAKVMVDKSIAFLSNSNAGAWKNLVYVLGDDGDENGHMSDADNVAERVRTANPAIELHKVYWDAYQRVSTIKSNTYPDVSSLLHKQMQDGALVMNYTGHGATYTLSHEFVLLREDFANVKSEHPALWVTAACDVMPFDGQTANIGETAVLNPNGGALAFYGTTRTVYSTQNLSMNRFFMSYLFSSDSQGKSYRLGDAIRLAKANIISEGYEGDRRENKLQYALLGDPALTITPPRNAVVLDTIAGTNLLDGSTIQLRAGQRVRMVGHVENPEGNALPGFQGVLSSRLFDSQTTVTCRNNAGATNAFVYKDRKTVLYESQDSIVDGKFEVSFVVPIDISYSNASGRIVFYAIDNTSTQEAHGYCEKFNIGGVEDNLDADSLGPNITAWLNSEDFQDGGVVNATPYFVAQLEDENGVNVSGTGVGHDLSLTVDGRPDLTFTLNDYYVREFGDFTRGTVAFTLPQLEAGTHSLTFRAWDLLNNMSSTTLSFNVNPSLKPNMLSLSASQNPATSSTNFLISYDLPGADCIFMVDVFDFAGHLLWTTTQTGNSATGLYSIPWNLCTSSGGRLSTGIYFYRCRMQSGSSSKVSKTQKIVILNNK